MAFGRRFFFFFFFLFFFSLFCMCASSRKKRRVQLPPSLCRKALKFSQGPRLEMILGESVHEMTKGDVHHFFFPHNFQIAQLDQLPILQFSDQKVENDPGHSHGRLGILHLPVEPGTGRAECMLEAPDQFFSRGRLFEMRKSEGLSRRRFFGKGLVGAVGVALLRRGSARGSCRVHNKVLINEVFQTGKFGAVDPRERRFGNEPGPQALGELALNVCPRLCALVNQIV
mmetsp:Transcript_18556/g.46723  ORF Transcript_18556/g.46723 Transcript_18556/m.46723 type:complete len:228 (-) Transcript_18556:1628-2311(-)